MAMPKDNELLNELLTSGDRYVNHEGYYRVLGYKDPPCWSKLPFIDFFEPCHETTHKKCLIGNDGQGKRNNKTSKVKSLMPLYDGIISTQSIVQISFGMYSASVVNAGLLASLYSQQAKTSANFYDLTHSKNLNHEQKERLRNLATTIRYIAFTLYEGHGLSGYTYPIWPIWGRILGRDTPTKPQGKDDPSKYISFKEGEDFSKLLDSYIASSPELEKGSDLLESIWAEVDSNIKPAVVRSIYIYYAMYKLYTQFESGLSSPDLFQKPNEKDWVPSMWHFQCCLAGFLRRAAKGLIVSKSYSLNEVKGIGLDDDTQAKRRLPLVLPVYNYLYNLKDPKTGRINLYEKFSDHKGDLTPFGELVDNLVKLHIERLGTADEIITLTDKLNRGDISYEQMKGNGIDILNLSQKGRNA